LSKNPTATSTDIRENLFPKISEKAKDNANYKIQIVLGRAYAGR